VFGELEMKFGSQRTASTKEVAAAWAENNQKRKGAKIDRFEVQFVPTTEIEGHRQEHQHKDVGRIQGHARGTRGLFSFEAVQAGGCYIWSSNH